MPRRSGNAGAIDSGHSDLYRQQLDPNLVEIMRKAGVKTSLGVNDDALRTSHCGLPPVNGSWQIWSGLAEAGTYYNYAVPMVLDTPQYP